jgi:hypothetical protein
MHELCTLPPHPVSAVCLCCWLQNVLQCSCATTKLLHGPALPQHAVLPPHVTPPTAPALQVDPQFYAFRWITLLLTQEFPFPDAVRMWDTILSDPCGRLDCLLRICLAMLLHVRQQLLEGDFAANVKLLQHYPSTDVSVLLHRAASLPSCENIVRGIR